MTPDDPIDQALAAIASIRGNDNTPTAVSESSDLQPEDTSTTHASESERGESERGEHDHLFAEHEGAEHEVAEHEVVEHEIAEHDAPATAPEPETEPAAVEGYARLGPGPLDAIRFRWTARRDDDGRYFVDETIGGSRPISTGPMPADEVIGFIDAQERNARERFDALKNEMTLARTDRSDRAHVVDDEHLSSDR
ncbi:MAG: hypothetical protein ABWY18_09100 [Tardiphaga sp.]